MHPSSSLRYIVANHNSYGASCLKKKNMYASYIFITRLLCACFFSVDLGLLARGVVFVRRGEVYIKVCVLRVDLEA